MESNHSVTAPGSDCVLGKHELHSVYDILIVPHLTYSSQPVWDFDKWYAQLDSWDRGIIHASQLKEYLIGVNYTFWGEISKLVPGLVMAKVNESKKLSQVINQEPGRSITPKVGGETYNQQILVN